MYTKDYIHATYKVLTNVHDAHATLISLERYLKKRGLLKLYPAILRGLIKVITQSEEITTPKVIIARTPDLKKHRETIDAYFKKTNHDLTYSVIVDPEIIGGFIVRCKDVYVDQSFKRTLLQSYHRIIE